MKELGEGLLFDPERGLLKGEVLLTGSDGYVPALFVTAMEGGLSAQYKALLAAKEWQRLPVNHTFVSYCQLSYFVRLQEDDSVREMLPNSEKEPLYKLTRAYMQDLIDRENQLVLDNPYMWFESAFYPSGLFADDGDFDIYNQYDSIPFGGFARSAFYFFIAETAKTYIQNAVLSDNLLAAGKEALQKCKNIFADKYNVVINPGRFRVLLETYLKWRFEQTELALAHDVTLTEDDLWQEILTEEAQMHKLFNENMNTCRLYGLRPLLELQGDLIKRMKRDHPYISSTAKRINPNNLPQEGDYQGLADWLESERREGRDYLQQASGKVTKLCDDINFKRLVAWYSIEADSLRHAINRKKKKNNDFSIKNTHGTKNGTSVL